MVDPGDGPPFWLHTTMCITTLLQGRPLWDENDLSGVPGELWPTVRERSAALLWPYRVDNRSGRTFVG